MITNPHNRPDRIEPDEDVVAEQPMRVRKIPAPDFDAVYNQFSGVVETKVVNVDAKIIEGYRHGEPVLKHYRNLREMMASPQVKARVRNAFNDRQLKDLSERAVEVQGIGAEVKKLAEASSFNLGIYEDETVAASGGYRTFPLTDVVLPSISSPYAKQMLWADYLDMHRKCLAGDTRVALLDGTNPTIQELAERGADAEFWVYAFRDGMVFPALARSPRQTGVMQTFDVELDNGELVRATATHPFMLRDGSYRTVEDLRPGDSLMPLYRRLTRQNPKGYEEVLHPNLRLWESTHRMVTRVTQPGMYLFGHWHHVDHANECRWDNRPDNLSLLTRQEHFKKTSARPDMKVAAVKLGSRVRSIEERRRMSEIQKRTWADPDIRERRVAGLRRNNHRVVAIRPASVEPVYDITVPGFSNFALTAGVFVHNSWEAGTRNPIGKRICRILPQFVLGRGAVGRIPDEAYQAVWDDFWLRNKMRLRMKMVLRELVMFGEVFLRYFQTRQGLVIRSIDPMTIWDIVTNPDDVEEVKYYHQQYVVLNTANVIAPASVFTPSTMVIRQIPASEVDHFAINRTSSEKRGRSELFAILGWLQRFKEFANDRVMINKMRSMFALDVSVDGNDADLTAAESQFSTPPGPGAVTIHNKSIAIDFKSTNTSAGDAQTDAEMILKIIAIGAGISEQFLGVTAQANRASALISTEPDVKNFEEYREIVEEMLLDASQRVWAGKRLARPKVPLEFTFPSIAQEDRSGKLKDLGFMEAMDWITKQRAATMAARELEITTYDYDNERTGIKAERGEEPVIAQGLQQLPKIQVAPAEQPGMGAGLVPGAEAGAAASNDGTVTQTSAQMGFRADGGGRALSDTKATLNRPGFTRGEEKAAIKNNRTSGTPLLHADRGEAPPRGWTPQAREKSLTVRRANAKARKIQMLERAAKPTEPK